MLAGLGFLNKPRIHDITTDVDDPPEFTAARNLRARWQNPVEYEGSRIAALQQQAYPDIAPIICSLTPQQAYTKARQIAVDLGWNILDEDIGTGRIEAVAITPLLRFRDDVVIRVRRQAGGTRIDLRSASRIGTSDFGTNAKRLRDFTKRLSLEL